jgi:hypothetical protein
MTGTGFGIKMPKPRFVLDSTIAIDLLNGLPSSKPIKAKLKKAKVYVSIGSEKDLRNLRLIEKKLGLVVYPKILYKGQICQPDEFE